MTDTTPTNILLIDWLTDYGIANRKQIEFIRSISDKKLRDLPKSKLPAITPSGVFSYRSKANLKHHTGLIQFDVDNLLTAEKVAETKAKISKMPYTLYCGLSVSGRGVWGLFEIAEPACHELHFQAMLLYFRSFEIAIDEACKDISRLRVISFDWEPYVNNKAKVFDLVPKPVAVVKKHVEFKQNGEDTIFDAFNKSGDIAQLLVNFGYKYESSKGSRHRFCRPDKTSGISVDYHEDRRVVYFFTSSTQFKPLRAYNAVQLFYTLKNCQSWKECAALLKT